MGNKKQSNIAGGARKVVLFLLRFLAASIVLYSIYMAVGTYYSKLVAYGSKPFLALFKYRMVMEMALKVTEEISLNPVVFLSLVIALPGAAPRVRLRAAVWGVVILTAANIATVFFAFVSYYRGSESLWTGTEFLNLTINFFLPLLLWIILMPVGPLISFRERS